jgi:hypothetical protein
MAKNPGLSSALVFLLAFEVSSTLHHVLDAARFFASLRHHAVF